LTLKLPNEIQEDLIGDLRERGTGPSGCRELSDQECRLANNGVNQ
jgi:hypothetical protein